MGSITAAFKVSAKEWNISTRAAWLIFALPIIGAVFLVGGRASYTVYNGLTKEDGPIEWVQFVFYMLTSLMSLGIAIKRFQARHPWQAMLFLGLAFSSFFIGGEEIAWGQRIFGLQTPKQLKEINHQGEITLHNIQIVQNTFNFVMFLGGLYGTVAYLLNQKFQLAKRWDQGNYLLVPPLFLVGPFFILFAYKLIRYTVWRTPGFTITRFAEWPELCLAFGLFIFTWLNYRRLASQPVQAVVPQTAVPEA